jgi:hypothetical protein
MNDTPTPFDRKASPIVGKIVDSLLHRIPEEWTSVIFSAEEVARSNASTEYSVAVSNPDGASGAVTVADAELTLVREIFRAAENERTALRAVRVEVRWRDGSQWESTARYVYANHAGSSDD